MHAQAQQAARSGRVGRTRVACWAQHALLQRPERGVIRLEAACWQQRAMPAALSACAASCWGKLAARG